MRWPRLLRRRRASARPHHRTTRRPSAPLRLLFFGALLPAVLASTAQAATQRPVGEVIVKFRAGERADALRSAAGLRIARKLPIPEAAVVRVAPGEDAEDTVARLERDPRVAWAEPNVARRGAALPDDPFAGEQWALERIGLPQAWERTTGTESVRVAIVDSGVNLDQPDLAANLATNPGESGGREDNGVDDDGNGFVDDWRGWDFVQRDNDPNDNHGHGSLVAGVAAARGNDGRGVVGAAWRAGVLPVRVLGNTNAGACSEIAAGMAYAALAGARIVNLSVGSDAPCRLERDVAESAPDTLFVVAAMNDGRDVETQPAYPCAYETPNIVCVTSTGPDDSLSSFANHGARSVDLAAPGEDVLGPIVTYGPRENVLNDGFEAPIAPRWATGGINSTWSRSLAPRTGGFALADSPFENYAPATDSWVRFAGGVDLHGRRDCAAHLWARWSLGPFDATHGDQATVEISRDGSTWMPFFGLVGQSDYTSLLVDLAWIEGQRDANLRIRLSSDASGEYDGVHVDDLSIFCVPPSTSYTGAHDEYTTDSGTSFAAPYVAGVAALILSAEPGLSALEVKERLLATVDRVPGLAGRTVAGGRLNAARALTPPASPAVEGPTTVPPPTDGDEHAAVRPSAAPDLPMPAHQRARALTCRAGAVGRAACRRLLRSLDACAGAKRCAKRALALARRSCRAKRSVRRRRACLRAVRQVGARL